jgi:hypothetical protein
MALRALMLAGLATFALAGAADAAAVLVTYTGTVAPGGHDNGGYFGSADGDLAGEAFTLRFTLDTATPGAASNQDAANTFFQLYGNGAANPLLAELMIKGMSQSWGHPGTLGDGSAAHYNEWTGILDSVGHSSDGATNDGVTFNYFRSNSSIYSNVNDFTASTDLAAPLDYTLQPGDVGIGLYEFYRFDLATSTIERASFGNLVPTRVTIAALNSVPEPSSWALMIVGFGAVGWALRRQAAAARSRWGLV